MVGIGWLGLTVGVELPPPVVSILTPLTALVVVVAELTWLSSGLFLSLLIPNISNSSAQLTRSSSLYARVFLRKSEALKLNGYFLMMVDMGMPFTFLMSSFSSLAFQGGQPNSIS